MTGHACALALSGEKELRAWEGPKINLTRIPEPCTLSAMATDCRPSIRLSLMGIAFFQAFLTSHCCSWCLVCIEIPARP
jgi:hypothetical protein